MADVPPDFEDILPGDAQVDFQSTWRDNKASSTTVGTVTVPMKTGDVETQTGSKGTLGTQTDEQGVQATPAKVKASGLADFVKKVEDMVTSELGKAVEEAEVLEPFTRAADDEQEPAICIQYLSPFHTEDTSGNDSSAAPATQINKHKLVVTCVSWSCTGSTVAASFGRYDVEGWCTFPGALTTWNLAREVNPTRPDQRIDTDTCLMSCAFHPSHPALIAGGTFNGELYVWDLSEEGDPQRGRSDVLLDIRHTEPIIAITWQYNLTDSARYGTRDKSYRLVTLGADGRVLTWLWHKLDTPVFGYQLMFPQPGVDRRFVWGGACMSFQREPRGTKQPQQGAGAAGGAGGGEAAGTFLVGTEGGKMFKCYNDANDVNTKEFTRAVTAGERVELRTPVREAGYSQHAGAVFGLDCSPFQRELFLSCATDGSVRLYSSLRMQPLLQLEPTPSYLFGVQWSPFRPLVFAAAAADGCVYMYDLVRGGEVVRPVLTLDANGMGKPVYALAFNPRKPDLLATGDVTGIQVWRLPGSLTEVRRGEDATLQRIAVAEDVVEMMRGGQGGGGKGGRV